MKSRDAYKTIGEVCDIVGLIDTETGKRKETSQRHERVRYHVSKILSVVCGSNVCS